MKKLIFTLMLVGCFQMIHSQNPQWTNYSNGDRIPVIKSSNEFIWIGYYGGVTRINTQTQEKVFYNLWNSNLPSQWVYSLDVDQNGTVWIGTNSGLCMDISVMLTPQICHIDPPWVLDSMNAVT